MLKRKDHEQSILMGGVACKEVLTLKFYVQVMPIGAQEWRLRTGLINASRTQRVIHTKFWTPSSFCCSLPSSTWRGWRALLLLMIAPLMYKITTALMILIGGGGGGKYPTIPFYLHTRPLPACDLFNIFHYVVHVILRTRPSHFSHTQH